MVTSRSAPSAGIFRAPACTGKNATPAAVTRGRDPTRSSRNFKAEFLNRFIAEHGVEFVIEFGCGDGNQLSLAAYPQYLGFDVSRSAVERCRKRFGADATKQFQLVSDYAGEAAPLAMSLDVIYHLVEDSVFHRYMEQLFDSSSQFVVIYSSNFDKPADDVSHVRHRGFTRWISDHRPEWQLTEFLKNAYPFEESSRRGSLADFYVFSKT